MKKILTSLFALMALSFVFTSCKNDSSETEEKFTQLTKEDINNSDNWLKGEWNGEIQTFDVQFSESQLKALGMTEEEGKTQMKKRLETNENPKLVGTISLSDEKSLEAYKKVLSESLSSEGDETFYINESKTKMILELKLSDKDSDNEDIWSKIYVKILYNKK